MGQKVNPLGFRVGNNKSWDSRWYAEGADYVKSLDEDFKRSKYKMLLLVRS